MLPDVVVPVPVVDCDCVAVDVPVPEYALVVPDVPVDEFVLELVPFVPEDVDELLFELLVLDELLRPSTFTLGWSCAHCVR